MEEEQLEQSIAQTRTKWSLALPPPSVLPAPTVFALLIHLLTRLQGEDHSSEMHESKVLGFRCFKSWRNLHIYEIT